MNPNIAPPTQRPLGDREAIREAIKLLRETVLEDRKQILLRVVFTLALVAFTVKDFLGTSSGRPPYASRLIGASFLCLFTATAIYFHHYHKAIGVVATLSHRLAYLDLGRADLEVPNAYWLSRRVRWFIASAFFYVGCIMYAVALFAVLW